MKKSRRMTWVLAAAVVGVGLGGMPSSAQGQQRVGGDGRALDANNRVGSGGINEPGYGGPPGVTGNQIVTGNVTGGQQFRGAVPYTDPFAFRGQTAGIQSDRFIRDSAGVPIGGVGQNNASALRPFYGQSQTVERPPGYQLEAPGTGFVPAPLMSRQPGDLRLGRPFEQPVQMLPQPGQLVLPGPVDPATQQPTVITASPLYGVRQWSFDQQADQQFLQGLNMPGTQRARLDQQTVQRMRNELESDPLPADAEQRGQQPNGAMDGRSPRPFDAPEAGVLGQGLRLQDQAANQQPLANTTRTDARVGQRLLTAPERQSAQYAEMQRRLQRFNRLPESMAALETSRQYNEQLRARQQREAGEAETGIAGGVGGPGGAGVGTGVGPGLGAGPAGLPGGGIDATAGGPTVPGMGAGRPQAPGLDDFGMPDYQQRSRDIREGRDPAAGTGTGTGAGVGAAAQPGLPGREPPMQVTSFAAGVQARGLADVLAEAEDLMRQGKFYTALDQYDLAEQVAPNNPLVNLGRAVAELGASYYARADQHLRDAFTRDPALLMAQYDIRGFLGEERLEYLIKDLRAISNAEPREPRSVFLLAFIDYNTGNPRRAAAYLDMAERRAGGSDAFFSMLRKHWDLPAGEGGAAQEGNK
jgi:tetratricopeptide (TPR) repeat protein